MVSLSRLLVLVKSVLTDLLGQSCRGLRGCYPPCSRVTYYSTECTATFPSTGFVVAAAFSVQVRHFQAFRPSAYAGKAHFFIQAVSNTSSALGRSPGLQASIQRNSSNNTAFSSSLTMSVPQDGLSPFTHSSNRLSHDHMSRSLLSGLPVSSNHLARSSHLSHHSDGRRPCR